MHAKSTTPNVRICIAIEFQGPDIQPCVRVFWNYAPLGSKIKNLFDRSAQFQILTRALGCNHVLVFKNTTTTPRFVSLVMNQMIGPISYRRGGNSICPSFMNKTVSSPTTPAREHYSEWRKGFLQHDFHTSGIRCMKVPNV